MNLEEAKKILKDFIKGDYDGTTAIGEAKGFLDAHHLRDEEVKKLVEAARNLVDSIKWSGDINQVNLAPKISVLREVLSGWKKDHEEKKKA